MFGYGLGILLLVAGAILKFAFTGRISGIDTQMTGVILMLAGLACILLSAIFNYMSTHRSNRATVERHETVQQDAHVRDERL